MEILSTAILWLCCWHISNFYKLTANRKRWGQTIVTTYAQRLETANLLEAHNMSRHEGNKILNYCRLLTSLPFCGITANVGGPSKHRIVRIGHLPCSASASTVSWPHRLLVGLVHQLRSIASATSRLSSDQLVILILDTWLMMGWEESFFKCPYLASAGPDDSWRRWLTEHQ